MEEEVDEAKRTDSQGVDEGSDGDAVDEDEDPEEHRGEPDVVHELSQEHEGAGTVTETEPDHLDEDQDHCENVQLRNKDLDEGDQEQTDNDDTLPFHHEGSSAVFFVELTCKEGDDDLYEVEVDEHRQDV